MCPDWGRSQLPSAEISFLGKLFKKLPTMDFSARTAKASGLGRETTKEEEEEGWKPLVGGSPFFSASCRTAAVRDARGANPKAEGGITLPTFPTACWKELAINLLLVHASLTSPLHSKKPPLQQGKVIVGGDPAQAVLYYSSRCTEVHCTTSHQGQLCRGLSHSSSRSPWADTALLLSPAHTKPQAPSPFKISRSRDKSSSSDQEARVGIC